MNGTETDLDRLIAQLVEIKGQLDGLEEPSTILNEVFRSFPDLTFLFDDEGRILNYFTTDPGLLHRPPDQFMGLKVPDIMPPRVSELIMSAARRVLESGKPFVQEIPLKVEKGERIFEANFLPIAEDRVFLLVKDITDKRRTESDLFTSDKLYKALVDSLPDLVLLTDFEGVIEFASKHHLHVLGYDDPDEVIGTNVTKHIHPEDVDFVMSKVAGIMKVGEIEPINIRFAKKDGSYIDAEIRPVRFLDEPGGPPKFISLIRDITTEKRTERDLQAYIERLNGLHSIYRKILATISVDEIADNIIDHIKGRIKCSRVSMALFGPEGGVGRILRIDSDDGTGLRSGVNFNSRTQSQLFERLVIGETVLIEDVQTEPSPIAPEDPILKKLSSIGIRCFMIVPMLVEGRLIGSINVADTEPRLYSKEEQGIVREVADILAIAIHQQRLNEEVQSQTTELEKRVKKRTAELEAFTFSVSHDLRSPLRAIKGFSEALLEDYGERLDEKGKDHANRIVLATKKMDILISDLLAYSHLSRSDLKLSTVSLQEVFDEVLGSLEADIENTRATVNVEGLLPKVMGDRATLVQVVENLLTNALKFVRPNTTPNIVIRCEWKDGRVRLWLEDNGIGIEKEYHEKIFQVFERLHGSEKYPGTGIGLAIVRIAMERMRGDVGLVSSPGKGTRFWIELVEGEKG